jgi:hypothetical protein
MNDAKEYIKSKHNGEIPYKYGADECARLMEAYAKYYHEREVKKLRLVGVVGRSELLNAFLDYCSSVDSIWADEFREYIDDYLKSIQ